MTDDELAAARRRDEAGQEAARLTEAASPAPWRLTEIQAFVLGRPVRDPEFSVSDAAGQFVATKRYGKDGQSYGLTEGDAAFIVAARTHWPAAAADRHALLALADRLRGELDEARTRLTATVFDRDKFQRLNVELAACVAAQSELLSRKAEKGP